MSEKECTKCGEVKPFSEYNKMKCGKHGLQFKCKACDRAYYEQNKKRIIARTAKYYDDNKDKISNTAKSYRKQNKEAILLKEKTCLFILSNGSIFSDTVILLFEHPLKIIIKIKILYDKG